MVHRGRIVVARPHAAYLLILGTVVLTAAGTGYAARRIRWNSWLRHHISAMALSYITMLTAFHVDNGPPPPTLETATATHLLVLPAAIGLPLLIRTLRRHPSPPARRAPEHLTVR